MQDILCKNYITVAVFYIIQQAIQPNPCDIYKKNIVCKRESEILANI